MGWFGADGSCDVQRRMCVLAASSVNDGASGDAGRDRFLLRFDPMLRRPILLALGVAIAACSSNDSSDGDARAGEIRTNDVWTSGVRLTGKIVISPGTTVEIASGATISCAPGVEILVGGVLRTKSTGARAKITCESWTGITVAQGGQLDLEGVDIEHAELGVNTTEGNGETKLTDCGLLESVHPFRVGPKSQLDLVRVKATMPATVPDGVESVAHVFGKLTATRLDLDAGAGEGIMLRDGGEAVIEDSTLKARGGLDLVSAYNAKSLKISYSTLTSAHCGPHVAGIEDLSIDHVTSENNVYGITIYGAAKATIRTSNFSGSSAWLDLQGDHGPVTFDDVYSTGNAILLDTPAPIETNKATTPRSDAKPR